MAAYTVLIGPRYALQAIVRIFVRTWVDQHDLDVVFSQVLVARQAPAPQTMLGGGVRAAPAATT